MLQDKHMIYIYLQGEYPHDLGGTSICQVKEYLEKLYEYVNMLSKTIYQEIYTLHLKSPCS